MLDFSSHIDHQNLLNIVIDLGIESVSVLQESKISFNQSHKRGRSSSFQLSSDWGSGFYINHGNREAFYSSNEYDRSYSDLIGMAKNLVSKVGPINQSEEISGKPISIDILKDGSWKTDPEYESRELLSFASQILDEDDSYNYRLQIDGEVIHKSFQSSYTNLIQQNYSTALLTIELFDRINGHNIYLVSHLGGIDQSNLTYPEVAKTINTMVEQFHEQKVARSIKSDSYKTILDPDTSYSLIHESVGHGCEGDQIISGDSFLSKRRGQKIAATGLTVIDDPHIRGAGWAEFDDEGTKTKGTILVDDGILADFLHTRRTAKIMGGITTGNARAASYLAPPETRQSNIFIEPRDFSLEELLEDVKDGIYVGPSISASTSIYSGEFIVEAQYGRIIKDGHLREMTKPVTFSGQSLDTLSKINAIGKDINQDSMLCMKNNSRIMIGALAPHLEINDLYLT